MAGNNQRKPQPKTPNFIIQFGSFLKEHFSLEEDKDDEAEVIQSVSRRIEFRGINLWTLICAIFIASIGLNINSSAVITGAFPISPLMGPIMGIGMGINDLAIIKRA